MAGRLALLALVALACAAPPDSPAGGGQERFEPGLAGLELSFVDPETRDRHQTVGPYRIVAREPGRVQIEGVDATARVPRRVTLIERGDELWAWTRIGTREFLARIH